MSLSNTNKPVRVIHPTVKIKNKNLDLSQYASVIETYKSLKNPAGTFVIELSTKNSRNNISSYNLPENIYNMIDPMDIIEIGITSPGLMVGLVDSPNKVKTISGASYSRSLQITGRDFAKLLIEDSIVYSPQLANNEYAAKVVGEERLSFMGQLSRGIGTSHNSSMFNSPVCALLFILRNIPAIHVEIPFTDVTSGNSSAQTVSHSKTGEYFLCDMKAFLGDRVSDVMISQFAGKVWNIMELCIDSNYYELFIDTVTVKSQSGEEARPCLFLRPKPFDRVSDSVIRIKETYKNDAPAVQALQSAASLLTGNAASLAEGREKAIAAGREVIKNLINFNSVINPRIEKGDIVFTSSGNGNKDSASKNLNGEDGGTSSGVTTFVTLNGLDTEGNVPDPLPPQFSGQRDVNKPLDPANLSMVVPWTWDGDDSFFRTMITNEKYHTIHDEDIIQEVLGVSDYEVIDFITVRSRKDMNQDPLISIAGNTYPLMDGYKIRKYGLRAFNAESNLLKTSFKLKASEAQNYSISESNKKDIFSSTEYINNRERIFNWYRYNDIFESGMVVIKGNQDIRIGDKIFLADALTKTGRKGIYAYVQGVKNRYEITSSGVKFETTLEITRGENTQDIEEYRSQKNSGSGSNLKLGTTYKNYDDSLGQQFSGEPSSPDAHNIIKYDSITGINELDAEKKDNQKPLNKPPGELEYKSNNALNNNPENLVPKYSSYISPTTDGSKINLGQMTGEGKPFIFEGNTADEIQSGRGTNGNSELVEIDKRIYQFLEAIGSAGFPFKIKVKNIIGGTSYRIENNQNKQISPHSLGKAVVIAAEGSSGSSDYIRRTTALISYISKLPAIDGIQSDEKLKGILNSRGAAPRIIIACPNQNNLKDIKLCKGISIITNSIKAEYKDKIQIIF
jgi:hypothetical protein